jgi:uncharacterized membrane protein YfcA
MTAGHICLLLGASFVAGALNAAAGGGSFLTFPALVFCGVPPIPANATNTVALWPGAVASIWAYRREMSASGRLALTLGIVSVLGGIVGALILLVTPPAVFSYIIPWLMLGATLLFACGKTVAARLRLSMAEPAGGKSLFKAAAIQFFIAIYGGFYGAGAGILMLAAFELLSFGNIHVMNALKLLLNACFNGSAVVTFILCGAVVWPQAFVVMAGGIAGGYGGAWLARRTPPEKVRAFVIAVGVSMTLYFFARLL